MFDRILYPTDFSDVANKALAYVKQLKLAGAKEVVLVRIITDRKIDCILRGMAMAGREASRFLKEVVQSLQEEAHQEARRAELELKEAGLQVKVRIETGVPHQRILEIAQEENVSVIVLGSHGRSNLSSALLGSVSDHVIRHSKQPVIVIKRD